MICAYPYVLTPDRKGGFSVTFPDVPEAITQGETEDEAHAMAEQALVTALSFYVDAGQHLPPPLPPQGRPVAYVPALVAAKLALHEAMLQARVNNVGLGQHLGVDEKAIRRLRDPLHRSHIENVEDALRALGYRVVLSVKRR